MDTVPTTNDDGYSVFDETDTRERLARPVPAPIRARLRTRYLEDDDYVVTFERYRDATLSMQVWSTDGEPMLRATMCYPEIPPLSDGHVWIKDCPENEGIAQALTASNVIAEVAIEHVPTGHAALPLYRLHPRVWNERR